MKITRELLNKYYQGSCSKAEQHAIEIWLDSVEAETQYPKGKDVRQFKEEVWNRLSTEMYEDSPKPVSKKRSPKVMQNAWAVAASNAILVGLVASWIFNNAETSIRYQTQLGEQKSITLSDGTKVRLNAGSLLDVPKAFEDGIREVVLYGEAYFEVIKDSLHPFTVKTEHTLTKVLGTKFNLYAFKNEPQVLTLNEGKVAFSGIDTIESDPMVLLPNEQGYWNKGKLEKRKVNAFNFKAWASNDLFFDSNLKQVFEQVERYFNATIVVENTKLYAKSYRGYHKNPTLESLLTEMGFVLQFEYRKEGDTIYVK